MTSLPNLKRVTKPDGRTYYYYQTAGFPLIALPHNVEVHSAEFQSAYQEAANLAGGGRAAATARRVSAAFSKSLSVNLRRAKERAARKGLPFDLTIEWALSELAANKWRCPVTNLSFQLDLPASTWRNPLRPSFDRVDTSLGYIKSNTRIVLLWVNLAKNDFDEETFRYLCSRVLRNKNSLSAETQI